VAVPGATAAVPQTRAPAPPPGGKIDTAPPPPAAETSPESSATTTPPDLEAEAAALFSDSPARAAAPRTVDFTCPFCDAELHLPADVAGKKSPCPECRRIIKVPELTKSGPKDWRNANVSGPSAARPVAEPEPEGAWGSTTVRMVGGEALVEAGVVKKRKRPKTLFQKAFLPGLVTLVVVGTVVGAVVAYATFTQNRERKARDAADAFAGSDDARKQVGPAGQAALFTLVGDYHLRTGKPRSGVEARDHYGKAVALLAPMPADSERDLALADLAPAEVHLGGGGEDVRNEVRLSWDEVHKLVRAALAGVHSPEGRLLALRGVVRNLVAEGQADRVLPLTTQVFSSPEADRSEALATAGLEFLAAGDRARAEKAADQALAPYDAKKPPPVKQALIALAVALEKKVPKAGKGPDEEADRLAGEAEGQARLGKWDEARQRTRTGNFGPLAQFRTLAAVALAALDTRPAAEAGPDVDAAVRFLQEVPDRRELSWLMLRLTEAGVRAGLPPDRLDALAAAIPDPALRGRAQFLLFQARLAANSQPAEEAALDKVEPRSVGRLLALAALARHNTALDPAWARPVAGWEEPRRAFASAGVALGLVDRLRK
jgi:hypothetical protein